MKKTTHNHGISLIALIVTIIILLILAGVSLSLVAGGNGIIGKAAKAVDATTESTAVEEIELIIAEANMEYYLDDTVTNETLTEYLAKKFSPRQTGSGAEVTFSENGSITYEGANGTVILLEMNENGKVEIMARADGSKIEKTVTYNANGGTGNVPATQTFERKATVNVDFSSIPTREGYEFLGWATTSNAISAQYTQGGEKTFTMGTSNITLYAVWQDVLIGADNYGDSANYSANGVDDWKVFLNDETYIYLIASDYLPKEKVPVSATGMTTANTYGAYWESVPSFQTGWSTYKSSFLATAYNLDNYTEMINSKCASTLLNSDNWSAFANGMSGSNRITGGIAIGGPTLEMYVKSWNAKGYTALYTNTNTCGYYIGTDLSPATNAVDMSSTSGYGDRLYFPHTEYFDDCQGYWLASPSSDSHGCLVYVRERRSNW